MKKTTKKKIASQPQPEQEQGRFKAGLLIMTCLVMLISGVFLAGQQHFTSIDYGMKNSQLQRQIDELEAEKRRLLLSREVSISPNEIKKSARKIGLLNNGSVLASTSRLPSPAAAQRASTIPAPAVKPLVVKTAAVSPSKAVVAVYKKQEKAERPRVVAAE